MGYARHVGRVGALAVALGVGLAVASSPGVAFADPGDSSSDGSSSSGADASGAGASGAGASGAGGAGGGSAPEGSSPGASTGGAAPTGATTSGAAASADTDTDTDTNADADTDTDTDADVGNGSAAEEEEPTSGDAVEETPVAEAPVVESVPGNDNDNDNDSPPESSPLQRASRSAASQPVAEVDTAVADAQEAPADKQSEALSLSVDSPTAPQSSDEAFAAVATALQAVAPAPQRPQTLIGAVTEVVAAILSPLLRAVTDWPVQIPFLTAALSLVRNEFEKVLNPQQNVAPQQTTSLVAQQALPLEDQHVLVIGIDGTNLSRILALEDPNQNGKFLELLGTSTTSAGSIVGHTTISNPSWTSILTGAWGERTGVINNVFTPWTYNRFATMFDQIEALNEDIDTTVIANWNVINAIGAAGAGGADINKYVTQIDGDTNWLATDDLVATLTVDAISGIDPLNTDPSLLFSYFVGVDENGHMYGGDSPEYTAALVNMNQNLGLMMQAVKDREDLTGEDWTIVVVTDHGHQPQQGFGHGFNSPDETSTFVIVDGPGFEDGWINQAYEIVDTTPTVLHIFGGSTPAGIDGVPIQTLGTGYDPGDTIGELVTALNYEIAQNQAPDFLTDTVLTIRTIFTSIPYFIYDFGLTGNSGLPSFLALPAQLLFSGLYVATNIPAQIVAFGTGVYGARLFPILPPPAPNFTPVNPQQTLAPAVPIAV